MKTFFARAEGKKILAFERATTALSEPNPPTPKTCDHLATAVLPKIAPVKELAAIADSIPDTVLVREFRRDVANKFLFLAPCRNGRPVGPLLPTVRANALLLRARLALSGVTI